MTGSAAPSPEDDERRLWADFREGIRTRLNASRPPKSSPADREWLNPIISWAANMLPNPEMAIRRSAEQHVIGLEKNALTQGNRFMLDYARGVAPLSWMDLGPLPFKLDRSGLRVRFDSALNEDYIAHARWRRGEAHKRLNAEIAVADMFDFLAATATERGLSRPFLLGDLPRREDGRLDDLGWDDETEDDE
jgi:hypothetical protein